MLIAGIALGLVLGLFLGGRLEYLADIRLRFLPLLFVAVIIRFATEATLGYGIGIVDTLRLPLLGAAYGLLLFTLWGNRGYPGLALAFVGIASNALVIIANGGRMPVWLPAYEASGLPGPLSSVLHVPLDAGTGPEFFLHLGPLSDVIPIPFWPLNNVASIGDIFLTAGLAFFLFATLIRTPAETQRAIDEAKTGRYLGLAGTARLPGRRAAGAAGEAADDRASGARAGTGLTSGLEEAAALERPLMLGAGSVGMASPGLASQHRGTPSTIGEPPPWRWGRHRRHGPSGGAGAATPAFPIPLPVRRRRRALLPQIRRHPYVRLALNGSFSALWVGQVISLFGDRVNQLALGAFVYEITDSAFALALTFLVGTIPNLIFSPVAGAFVDRWDKKQVLVVSDILRAALVLLVPVAVLINVWLAYPLVFLITTVSIFFRPARIAILPRIVPERGPAVRQLGPVGGRDDRGRRELPDRGPVRGVPRRLPADRLLVRRRDVPRLRPAPGDDRRAAAAPAHPVGRQRRRRRSGRRSRSRAARRPTARRRPRSPRRSSRTSRSAGRSCVARPCCWRTRSRARPASSRSAS